MNGSPDATPSSPQFGLREDKSSSLVLLCGLVTSALALVGVYVLDATTEDFHIMGWYANYILPVGALIVGVVASSGYGLASWFSGVKITRSLLWIVLGLQFFVYFGAQYIEFKGRHLGSEVGFFQYYDFVARSWAWKHDDGTTGEPLGVWGYAFRGLELLGFLGGSIIVPAVLWKAPYCHACQRYMRARQLMIWPGSVPSKKVKKSDATAFAAHQGEQQQAFETGKQTWADLKQLASNSKGTEFQNKLAMLESGKKAAAKLPRRIALKLVSCKRCSSGWLQADVFTGQGREIKHVELERADVQPEFVRSLSSVPKAVTNLPESVAR